MIRQRNRLLLDGMITGQSIWRAVCMEWIQLESARAGQYQKVSVRLPHAVAQYNRYMGGVDRTDENTANYRIGIRSKKWWWPVFVFSVGTAFTTLGRSIGKLTSAENSRLTFWNSDVQLSERTWWSTQTCQRQQVTVKQVGYLTSVFLMLSDMMDWITGVFQPWNRTAVRIVTRTQRRCAKNAQTSICTTDCVSKCFTHIDWNSQIIWRVTVVCQNYLTKKLCYGRGTAWRTCQYRN